jgi:hypothetical protein
MNRIDIKNAEYVEVPIPTGNTKRVVYFPDLPNLRKRPIFGIEAFSSSEQVTANSGATVQAAADFPSASVTLYFDGGEYIVVPLSALRRISIGAGGLNTFGDIPNLNGQDIVWTKSYVAMNNNVGNFAGKNFLFNVYYDRNYQN